MHSVFARNVSVDGEDEDDDPIHSDIAMLISADCPACGVRTRVNSDGRRGRCDCEEISWRFNLSVTTEDLPPYACSIAQVRLRALQLIAEAAAAKNRGEAARNIVARLEKKFGRRAVDEAICASKAAESDLAAPSDQSAGDGGTLVSMLSGPSRAHGGQRTLTERNLRRAGLRPTGFTANGAAQFEGRCPNCTDSFQIDTDSFTAACRCEDVVWRLNLAVLTHDFPPHSWHPQTIAKDALLALFIRDHSKPYDPQLMRDLEEEFGKREVFCSIMEV